MNTTPAISRLDGGEAATFMHLGMHKTGTTYIQSLAHCNARELQSRNVLYPVSPSEAGTGHHSIMRGIWGDHASRADLTGYKALADAEEHVLLSSEDLSTLPQAALTTLAQELHPRRRTFAIVYFREPAGFARSYVQERIKHGWQGGGGDEAHAGEMAAIANARGDGPELTYVHVAEKVRESFGSKQTIFVAFDNVVSTERDIFQHFLEDVIGIQGLSFDPAAGIVNEHAGFQLSELQRLVHRLAIARCHTTNISVSLYVQNNFQRIVADIPELASLAEFQRSMELRSRAGAFKTMESTLSRRFGDCFLNAAGKGLIFNQAYAAELSWCDVGAFGLAFPRAIQALEGVLDEIIATVPSLSAQSM